MKKIIGLMGVILTFMLVCVFATGCNGDGSTTKEPAIPGIGSSTGTTDTTVDTNGTTDASASTSGTAGTTVAGQTTASTSGTTSATTTKKPETTTTKTNTTTASTTKPTGTTEDPSKLVIFLDPGHGGKDPGVTADYDFDGSGTNFEMTTYKEADINLAVALEAKARLEALGYQVILSRTNDTFIEVADRPAAANKVNAAMFISIHVNSENGDTAHGFEAWYSGKENLGYDAKAFAQIFNEEFEDIKDVKNDNKDIAYPNMTIRPYSPKVDTERFTNGMGVLRGADSDMPSALLELGFLSNEKDAFMLRSEYWQKHAAEAIKDAVVAAHIAGIYKK